MKHEFRDTRTTMWSSKTVCSVNSQYFVCCHRPQRTWLQKRRTSWRTLNNLVICTFRHLIDAKLLYLGRKREIARAKEREWKRKRERERDVCARVRASAWEKKRERENENERKEERLKRTPPFIYWPVTRIHYFCSLGLTKWKLINRKRIILKEGACAKRVVTRNRESATDK